MAIKLPDYRQADDSNNFEYYLEYGKVKRSAPKPAILLIGGAEGGTVGEDAATKWFLEQANYGDYLVLRCGGVGRQAQWITDNYSDLINSAAELSIDSREAANNPEVVQYIKNADALYFAGGDQNKYEDCWEGTATEEAINYLINHKKVPVGGTSAGMAILGEYYYAPSRLGLLSSEILNDPFHENTQDIYHSNFLQVPYLKYTITDTHLDRCNDNHPETRYGRIFGLMARIMVAENHPVYAIGLEEGAFVAIDENGIAQVFGNGSDLAQDAYFLQTNGTAPEQIKPGLPLIWDNKGRAVKAYKIQGTPEGSGSFDLNNWLTASGGTWEYWFTTGGDSGFRQERIRN
ncbi:MAG: cyanophycinase [Richelia sp. RM2_1_2]|nr:cyanophycinase [Richelia sp. SM2_1_7]NJM21412.1 cyanophycinase [Richelia sp. SM1_7_0]NJN10737.1 cyanophycinase [Richelia sp. RM1_1_1]NJO58158.1 cyanophycinase [Richelia sp. RM2_1_2]